MDHPIAGVGIGNFEARVDRLHLEPGTTYRTDRVIDNPGVTHNSYLGPFAEIGIVGVYVAAVDHRLLDRLHGPGRPALQPQRRLTDGIPPAACSSR